MFVCEQKKIGPKSNRDEHKLKAQTHQSKLLSLMRIPFSCRQAYLAERTIYQEYERTS